MRIFVYWIGPALPFVKIGETVVVGVLIKSVGVFDRQTVFFEPIIGDWGMHLGVLKRGRQAVCTNEMSFGNEKPRARAAFPLCRLLELLCRAIEFHRDGGLRGSFCVRLLCSDKPVAKLDDTPPNGDGRNEKKHRCRDENRAIVLRLNPVQNLCHG